MAVATASGPFYLQRDAHAAPGDERLCVFRTPSPGVARRGAVLAVHAFAEEMNKSRAAVADGARALAQAGYAVLQIDLTGCGDSAGDFEDATWDAWLADLEAGWAWLARHAPGGMRWLWGLRAGALLADRFAARCEPRADGLLLWQPVVNGAQHLGQFLRLKTVGGMLREGRSVGAVPGDAASATRPDAPGTMPAAPPSVARVAQPSPRTDLASGLAVEVAGYRLTPALADALEGARLGSSEPVDGRAPPRVRWFEVTAQAAATLTPIATRVVERWREAGADVAVATIAGPAFWQTQEVERCHALVAATVAALDDAVTTP